MRFRDKVVWVTGASSGIGEACALRLARAGWRVFAGVRRTGDAPPGTEELLIDVTNAEQIRAASTGYRPPPGTSSGALAELSRIMTTSVGAGTVCQPEKCGPELRGSMHGGARRCFRKLSST